MASHDTFNRAIASRHAIVNTALLDLRNAFATLDQASIRRTAKICEEACKNLRTLLADPDVPAWLSELCGHLNYATTQPGKLGSSILSAMNYYQIARDHKWTFQPRPDVTGIDFDAIYLQQLQMSNLPLLYDEVLDLISKIIDSGAVDQISVMKSLSSLQETVRINSKNRSVVSSMWTLSFAKEVLSQTTIVALKRTPVVGILFEGLGNALEKLQNENEAVCAAAREKSQEEVNRYLVTKINSLTQNDYPLLQIVKEFEGEVSDGGFAGNPGDRD